MWIPNDTSDRDIMVSVINGSSEGTAFLFGGDRLLHVITLFYFFVYVGHPSSGLRGAVHSALFRRAGRDYCCVT